ANRLEARCRDSEGSADGAERRAASEDESESLVRGDRGDVLGGGVHECAVAALLDMERHIQHESRRESLSTVVDVGRDGADLGPSLGVETLAGHGDQAPAAADADVPAELMRA